MALAPPAPIQWIPEDDLLLKNAVEAGASLEALAKGAVQFSRRFTFRELQDRWHALLYDPGISAQSSAHMFELEISGINHSSKFNRSDHNIKGNKGISQKRKSESIRRKYYALRKKNRNEIFSNSDIVFLEPNPQSKHYVEFNEQVRRDGNPLGQDCVLGDNISDLLGLQEEQLDFLRHALTVTSDTTNVPQIECSNSFQDNHQDRMIGSHGFDENALSSLTQRGENLFEANAENRQISLISKNSKLNENSHNSSVGFEDRKKINYPNSDEFASLQTIRFTPNQPEPVGTVMGDTAQVDEGIIHDTEGREDNVAGYRGEFANPDSLLNLSIDVGIPLVDVEDVQDKSFIDNVNPDCLDSRNDGDENEAKKVELENITSQASSVLFPSENPVVLEVVTPSVNAYEQINVPIKPAPDSDFAEVGIDKICCTLNTEDTEIPCNDDIFLLIHPSSSFGGSATQPNSTVSSAADNQRVIDLPSKTKVSTKAFGWTQKVKAQGLLESHSVNPIVGRAAKTELRDFRSQSLLPGFASKISTKGKSVHAIPKVPNKCNKLVDKNIAGHATRPATVTEVIRSTEAGCGKMVPQESVVDSLVSDEEEFQMGDDVPYFSDIEAMILEMDLDPYDQDSQVIKQAPIYQHDETRRTIIRLEQGARSYLERAMTSHGAFAILYGRHLRYYITKPEVLLGRSTDEIDVDIDLGKEGRANKISRRQAIIKMEADGSFFIKNIGKSSVSVNGISLTPRQLLALSSSCLIEIRGMDFVFEINQRHVKKHLGNIFKKK